MLESKGKRSQIISDFNSAGFICIPDFFSIDEVESINLNLNRIIEEVFPNIPENEVFYDNQGDLSLLKQISSLD